ncbi:unnamed protein product [Penicillium glandicola]
MGTSPEIEIPETLEDWRRMATQRQLENTTLYSEKLVSASKIGFDQFLLFRVIWKIHKANQIVNLLDMKGWIKEAEKKLRSYQSWSTYCESVELPENRSRGSGEPSKATPEGNFAIVRHYQREVRKTKSEVNPQAFDTPIASRTRAKTNHAPVKQMARLGLDPFTTPTKNPNPSSSRQDDPFEDDSPNQTPSTGPSPPTTISREMEKFLYPPTKDEQIVNTALIVFLNALTTHFDFYSNWTLHRKPFVATFENAQFEARTDGYLDSPGGKTRVLIEVKPVMQESAQMVAWIKSDNELAQRTNTTRFHISQDRHQVFVTVAEYGENYLKYLSENKPSSSEDPSSFLTMNQYGPWDTSKKSSIKEIGTIILAITLRAEREIKEEKKKEKKSV